MDAWSTIITSFLLQAQEGDLKTSSYPKEWNGLKMKVSFGMGAPARIPWIAFIAPEMQEIITIFWGLIALFASCIQHNCCPIR